jgi:hypothetical protein
MSIFDLIFGHPAIRSLPVEQKKEVNRLLADLVKIGHLDDYLSPARAGSLTSAAIMLGRAGSVYAIAADRRPGTDASRPGARQTQAQTGAGRTPRLLLAGYRGVAGINTRDDYFPVCINRMDRDPIESCDYQRRLTHNLM